MAVSRAFVAHCAKLFVCIGLALAIAPAAAAPSPKHSLFYLHGAIVEQQGPFAVSERFGRYDYHGILQTFRDQGFEVISEVRARDTEADAYAAKVIGQVRDLVAGGVAPSQITVVGASKGAIIASLVSARMKNSDVRYVLLAACNDWLIRTHHPQLTGAVLSIYDDSDEIAGSCQRVRAASPHFVRFEEIRLGTGLGHGIVYRPMKEWVSPAAAWATR